MNPEIVTQNSVDLNLKVKNETCTNWNTPIQGGRFIGFTIKVRPYWQMNTEIVTLNSVDTNLKVKDGTVNLSLF